MFRVASSLILFNSEVKKVEPTFFTSLLESIKEKGSQLLQVLGLGLAQNRFFTYLWISASDKYLVLIINAVFLQIKFQFFIYERWSQLYCQSGQTGHILLDMVSNIATVFEIFWLRNFVIINCKWNLQTIGL